MKLLSISAANGLNYKINTPAFAGIIGKTRLFDVENFSGDYLYKTQKIDYFQFQDDSPKELEELRSKYEFSANDKHKPLPSETIRFQKADESDILIIKVPLTMREYKKYIDNKLTPEESERVEDTLKEEGLRELLKKKIALLPLKENLYKSLYLPWF